MEYRNFAEIMTLRLIIINVIVLFLLDTFKEFETCQL